MPRKPRHLKTPTQLWVADNRARLELSSLDLAKATGVSEDTARGWESRGRPGEEALETLERLFGRPRPDGADTPGGQSDVAAAIREQTGVIAEQTTVMRELLAYLRSVNPPQPEPEAEADEFDVPDDMRAWMAENGIRLVRRTPSVLRLPDQPETQPSRRRGGNPAPAGTPRE